MKVLIGLFAYTAVLDQLLEISLIAGVSLLMVTLIYAIADVIS